MRNGKTEYEQERHWVVARTRRSAADILLCITLFLAGCVTHRPQSSAPSSTPPTEPTGQIPSDVTQAPDQVPDATPKPVTRATLGNPAFYEVFGKRYFVLPSAEGFTERGVASWYGPGFHKERTAIGDPYDMYGMTAAHKTLPLPCYARITNLSNGRSVVVYINDRGPFKDGRIVDLSYTAASKLDILRAGTAFVELKVLTAGMPDNSMRAATTQLFVQAGAFADENNAQRLQTKLRSAGYDQVAVLKDQSGSRPLHRVRIGPVATVAEFDKMLDRLKSLGIGEARLAAD